MPGIVPAKAATRGAGQAAAKFRTSALARTTSTEWISTGQAGYVDLDAFRSGVEIKILYHDLARGDPQLAGPRQADRATIHARHTPARMPAMIISDRVAAIVFRDGSGPSAGMTWTNQPEIISALALLFDQAWNAACPPGAASGRLPADADRHRPDGAERDLLELLATGATDEVAARRLGVSLRTARRHIAILMSRLDAVSRFQAGAEAARRGWLALPPGEDG